MLTSHAHARRRTAALAGLIALLLTTILGAAAASAAPPYASTATITSVDFSQETVQTGSNAELDLTWSLPDDAVAPAGLVVDLPAGLQGRTDAFPMTDTDGAVMGQCTVTATQLFCDIDADYLAANPRDVHGDASFWVKVTTQVSEETEVVYDVDGVEGRITVTPPVTTTCPYDCPYPGRGSSKWGSYDREANTIAWHVVVKAEATGMAGGLDVQVVDHVGPQQTITSVQVRRTSTLAVNGNGYQVPTGYTAMPTSSYTVSADRSTVAFTSEEHFFYIVDYTATVADGGASGTYTNAADVSIEGQRTKTVTATVERQGGGATGTGTDVGRFAITKNVIGAADAIDAITFDGTFQVTTPAGAVIDGTFEVADGDTWTSAEYPRGSVVHLTETAPTEPGTVTWAEPVFSENDLTLVGGTTTAVTLTNEATLRTGAFSVAKALTGDGAALVPDDATFVVGYSYPAGAGFEAGGGELLVPADGTVVTSPQLPVGAVVTLTENAPDAVDGVTWGEPVFSTTTVTIGADEVVAVELTNTATSVPPTETPSTESPSTPVPTVTPTVSSAYSERPGPSGGPLADTGADVGLGAGIAAIGLVLAGSALVMVRRRQRAVGSR